MTLSGEPLDVAAPGRARSELVGRDVEFARLDDFLRVLTTRFSAMAITGEAGIGKSSLWKYVVDQARRASYAVLAANPAESERALPFAGLGDLLRTVPDEVYERLPPPQRDAIRVALIQQAPPDPPMQRHTVAVAVLSAVRHLATSQPVLVAVDDLQWLDAPTLQVLRFMARRLESEAVGLLTTARQDEAVLATNPESLDVIRLGPLTIDAIDELIVGRLGANLTKPVLQQLHMTSGGNPFYAIEIARSLLSKSPAPRLGDRLPVPSSLQELVRKRIRRLRPSTREVLLMVAVMSQPTDDDLAAAMGPMEGRFAVDEAIQARVVERSNGCLRFTHPLIGSVVYGDAPGDEVRRLHNRLALVVDGLDERARHLAIASADPSAPVADELESAAGRAIARGAPESAADLMERAGELTPADLPELRQTRILKASDHLLRIGETTRAGGLLRSLAAEAGPGPLRAQALQRLALIAWWTEGVPESVALMRSALSDCDGAQPFAAVITCDLIWLLLQRGDLVEANSLAHELVPAAEHSGDRHLIFTAHVLLVAAECLIGKGVRPAEAANAKALIIDAPDSDPRSRYTDPVLYLGVVLKWIDDFAGSRDILRHHLEHISERQEESSLAPVLFHLAELECWAGNWDAAAEHAEQIRRAVRHSGQRMSEFLALIVDAHLHALRGEDVKARASGFAAVAIAERFGDTRFLMRVLAILGFTELSSGDANACLEHLGRLRRLWEELHYADPGVIRFQADEIEAMIDVGRLDDAAVRTDDLQRQGAFLDRRFAIATGGRCRALVLAAHGRLREALAAADAAVVAHDRLAQPLELARTLLVRGSIQRRLKERRLARESLERALAIFGRLGAARWSDRTHKEIARIGGRQRSGGLLTSTERAVANLAAEGATNREIAARLFISLKTVESNLSKVYRKAGLRSRTELAARMGGEPKH